MSLDSILEKLGVGLSQILRYSFGGFLFIGLALILNPATTSEILKTIPWQVTTLVALIIGIGVYVTHRGLIIPIHHLGLSFIFRIIDLIRGIDETKTISPTRWLGKIGVPWSRRMLAYSALRWSDFFSETEKEALNVAHAEGSLIVMLAEGFGAAALYSFIYPDKSKVNWIVLSLLSVLFVTASYMNAVSQHRLECLRFRADEDSVRQKLQKLGILSEDTDNNH